METSTLAQALQAVAAGDTTAARASAAQAADHGSLLGAALAEFLQTESAEPDEPGEDVYADPAAFEAFVEGGGNLPLYRATSAALARLYDQHQPAALLDIGCGNGRALLPALHAALHQPSRIGLVEPSPALLSTAVSGLPPAGIQTWPTSVQAFLDDLGPESHWPVAQSTFALHTIPHDERTAVLAQLRPHVNILAIADFDVPDHSVGSLEQLRFLAETYERGLAEYGTDRALVAQGFLLPVLVGQLRPGATRVTWEQSKERWREQLIAAGYRNVNISPLYDYWSSPAFLLTAS
jgi:SAM-dependent methyltransferase